MALHLQSTVFGQLMRLLSSRRVFKYPDEIDLSLWEKAVQQDDTYPEPSGNASNTLQGTGAANGARLSPISQGNHGNLIVGWYGPDDPENPQHWPRALKHLIAFQMCILNFAVYIASSIYTPGEHNLMEEFQVSEEVAILGLSLFTMYAESTHSPPLVHFVNFLPMLALRGYGFGPMLWSPLSEIPRLGRSGIFFYTLLAFILFQLPVGLAPNVVVFLIFRWVTGFCGSPCLSTGGGTINDIYPPTQVPFLICIWASAGVLGPVFGPLIGGYLAPAMGWRWTIWAFTFLCCLVLVIMFFFLPETSADTILYKRAARLSKASGRHLISRSEADSAHHTARDDALLLMRAFTLTLFEPVVLLMNLYAGLLYGVLFIWFESFPLVFGNIYHFTTQQQGLVFLAILVFTLISLPVYMLWMKWSLVPKMGTKAFKPELMLLPTFVGCWSLPLCLFWFGWTSRSSIHWIVPVIGSGTFAIGVVTLFNTLYTYLGMIYPKYAASIFAGAALFRALFGATFPLFAQVLFDNLGVGPGNSLLGGISVLFIPVPFVFYKFGERIRRHSKHASA
ncbi:uncharacterized protein JN550_012593 [Neoarthrinium moseri]|uniref:uncharacterized protein n=1 Tax=Neoarthrinium moseri TaxID=1658444 RepID=UPI001FDAFDE1|nr:uncharacterized protein JN550_012593 [Neoarthrinium moseri]KAI1858546.1 hypothetical protein JN550_012593 [Neoarthrinium moseri]